MECSDKKRCRRKETFTETDENILHSLPKYFNHFSAFLWPHLVVECRGPLSMFNCVSVPVPFTMLIIIIINVSAPPFLYLTNQFLGQYELAT